MESKKTHTSNGCSFSREEIEQQLQRLLQAPQFCDAPRLCKFLSFVVLKTIDEDPKTITSYEIAIDAFHRSTNFDPNDPYIRNIAVLVRKALSAYYDDAGPTSENRIRIEIPRGNYLANFDFFNQETEVSKKRQHTNTSHTALSDSRKTSNPYISNFDSISSPINKFEPRTFHHKSNLNSLQLVKPTLVICPIAGFGNEEHGDTKAIAEIIKAEITSGFSQPNNFNVVSLPNYGFSDQSKKNESSLSSHYVDYILIGKYKIADDIVLLNIELSESLPGAEYQSNPSKLDRAIVVSEFLRFKIDTFYFSGNDELKELSKRLKNILNQRTKAYINTGTIGNTSTSPAIKEY